MAENDLVTFHRMLLCDAARMAAYRAAIQHTVHPGDVVLDIGSGTGILGLFACQAGARKVYCVERTDIIGIAELLASANGFADRMEFIKVDLPEAAIDKVDVIVSELVGKSGIGQNMTGLVGMARDRWLKPGGRVVPDRVNVWMAPVEDAEFDHRTRLPDRSLYNLDFAAFAELSANRPMSVRIPATAIMAEDECIFRYSARESPHDGNIDAMIQFDLKRAGRLGGFCTWFTADLCTGIELANAPPGTDAWDNFYFMLPKIIDVLPEDRIDLHFRAREGKPVIWIWDTSISRAGTTVAEFRQSSIF